MPNHTYVVVYAEAEGPLYSFSSLRVALARARKMHSDTGFAVLILKDRRVIVKFDSSMGE